MSGKKSQETEWTKSQKARGAGDKCGASRARVRTARKIS